MFVSTLLTNPTVALNIVQSGGWGGGSWPSGTFLVSSLRSDPRKITTPVFDTEKIFCRNRNIFDFPYSYTATQVSKIRALNLHFVRTIVKFESGQKSWGLV